MKNNAMVRVLLAASLLCLFLGVFTSTARAGEVWPTTVYLLDSATDEMALVLDAPVLHRDDGHRFLVCATTTHNWPNVMCMVPDELTELQGGARLIQGEWEPARVLIGGREI